MKKNEIAFFPVNEETTNKFINTFYKFSKHIECVYTPSYSYIIKNYNEIEPEEKEKMFMSSIDDNDKRAESFFRTLKEIKSNDRDYPKSFEEYKELLSLVKKVFDVKLLIQKNDEYEIKDYYNLGYRQFIIDNDDFAKQIKKKYNDILLTLSINRKLSHEELLKNDLSCYDYIILNCRYNRRLSLLKELPKKYKYILLPNSDCDFNGERDWLINRFDNKVFLRFFDNLTDSSSYLFPNDLKYFDDYVDHYMIQGREKFQKFLSNHMKDYLEIEENYYDL